MRYYPESDYDYIEEGLEKDNIKKWQLECLKYNPNYCGWGNNEEYMIASGNWNSAIELYGVRNLWKLNDLNELINFYFEVISNNNEPELNLQMWFIHPRKGASRGVKLLNIKEEEVSKVIDYLKEARERNYNRFSKL